MEIGWYTDIWCELPREQFKLHKTFCDIQMPITGNKTLQNITNNPFSVALTKRDFVCYSEEIEKEKIK